jgi:hypothetical protein
MQVLSKEGEENMRKASAVLLAFLFFLAAAPLVFAGGAPSGDFLKGYITQADKASNTVIFEPIDGGQSRNLALSKDIKAGDITLNKKVLINLSMENGHKVISKISPMFVPLVFNAFMYMIFVGFAGGLLSGFIGSGGAFVMTPCMMSIGVPGAIAVASNMCHKFPKSMVGGYKRYKYGQADLKLGVVVALSAIAGVQLGVYVQRWILDTWGQSGSSLYVSLAYVIILIIVGSYVFNDAWKLAKKGIEVKTSKWAQALQKMNLPPMIHFKRANVTISLWFTIPVGMGAGLLAATIGVGGFIGVPGMIYLLGASALVSSASELIVAFIMGLTGSLQWGFAGLIDIRLTILLLAGSLFGVQLGALGTTYVKDHIVKLVMGSIMLVVAVSRGLMIPVYLSHLGLADIADQTMAKLDMWSFIVLVISLTIGTVLILFYTIKGMITERKELKKEAVTHISYQPTE